jgi:hypothetical protein
MTRLLETGRFGMGLNELSHAFLKRFSREAERPLSQQSFIYS